MATRLYLLLAAMVLVAGTLQWTRWAGPAVLAALSILWLRWSSTPYVEGRTLVVITPQHGLTTGDLVGLAGLAVSAASLVALLVGQGGTG